MASALLFHRSLRTVIECMNFPFVIASATPSLAESKLNCFAIALEGSRLDRSLACIIRASAFNPAAISPIQRRKFSIISPRNIQVVSEYDPTAAKFTCQFKAAFCMRESTE
jgi:hypothetical protein